MVMKSVYSEDFLEVQILFQITAEQSAAFMRLDRDLRQNNGTCENHLLYFRGTRKELVKNIRGPWSKIFDLSQGYPTPKMWKCKDTRYSWYESYEDYLLKWAPWAVFANNSRGQYDPPERFISQRRIYNALMNEPDQAALDDLRAEEGSEMVDSVALLVKLRKKKLAKM